jgi:hypothetical protein
MMAYAREYVVMGLSSVIFGANIMFEELDVSLSGGERVGRSTFSDGFKRKYILHHFTRTQVRHSMRIILYVQPK